MRLNSNSTAIPRPPHGLKAILLLVHNQRLVLLVFLISLAIFGLILATNIETDIQAHATAVITIAKGLPPNFLYYVAVYALALFNTDKASIYLASMILLAASVTAKFIITRRFAQSSQQNSQNPSQSLVTASLISVLMLFTFSLPIPNILHGWYLGQIPSNLWHNSTTIFLMPFALLLFITSYEQLKQPSTKGILLITLLCVLNILIKPSFFFVFSIAYPLLLMVSFGLTKRTFVNLLPVFLGGILLVLVYYLIYKLARIQNSEPADIIVRPFVVWHHFSPNIILSFLASLVFPITYFIFYWKESLANKLIWYAVVSYMLALVIFSLLQETGVRSLLGNFFWQCVVCSYILFMVLSMELVKKGIFSRTRNWKNKIILAAYSVHVISGVIYLAKILLLRDYG